MWAAAPLFAAQGLRFFMCFADGFLAAQGFICFIGRAFGAHGLQGLAMAGATPTASVSRLPQMAPDTTLVENFFIMMHDPLGIFNGPIEYI